MMRIRRTKPIKACATLLIATSLLFGCVSPNEPSDINIIMEKGKVSYTNLSDEATKAFLKELLLNAGIKEEKVHIFFKYLDLFNESVDKSTLVSGFKNAKATDVSYDAYAMQEQWMKKNPNFEGYNCRITAYSLFSDFINAKKIAGLNTENIIFDIASLKADSSALHDKAKLDSFESIYARVATKPTKDIKTHVAIFKKAWQDRGVTFKDNPKLRLISVVFHNRLLENDDHLMIGHTGLLLPEADGRLFFLEKVAFQEPYRLNKFENREALVAYLMEKYNVEYGQERAEPFVLENDTLISQD